MDGGESREREDEVKGRQKRYRKRRKSRKLDEGKGESNREG